MCSKQLQNCLYLRGKEKRWVRPYKVTNCINLKLPVFPDFSA